MFVCYLNLNIYGKTSAKTIILSSNGINFVTKKVYYNTLYTHRQYEYGYGVKIFDQKFGAGSNVIYCIEVFQLVLLYLTEFWERLLSIRLFFQSHILTEGRNQLFVQSFEICTNPEPMQQQHQMKNADWRLI